MKILARPQSKLTIAISYKQAYRQNKLNSSYFQYRKIQKKWKFLLLGLSFFTFLIYPESPEITASVCNKYNSEMVCQSW